jgi:hypothetical protein
MEGRYKGELYPGLPGIINLFQVRAGKGLAIPKINIYTSYQRNEKAWAAVQMADWFARSGCQVVMMSSTKVQPGIHPHLDS